VSALLDALRIAEQRLRRLALILAIGSPATAASSYALLALEPKAAVSAMLALLLAVLAQRGARRSRLAWIVTGALHLLLAVLIAQRGVSVPNPLLPFGIAVHALFGLVAVLGLRALSRLDAAEVDAARPIPISAVNLPGPSVPLPFPPAPVPKRVLPTLPNPPAIPAVVLNEMGLDAPITEAPAAPIDVTVRAAEDLGAIASGDLSTEPSTDLSTAAEPAPALEAGQAIEPVMPPAATETPSGMQHPAADDGDAAPAFEAETPAATAVTSAESEVVEPARDIASPPLATDIEGVHLAPPTDDLELVAESPLAAVSVDRDETALPEPAEVPREPETAAAELADAIGSVSGTAAEVDAVPHSAIIDMDTVAEHAAASSAEAAAEAPAFEPIDSPEPDGVSHDEPTPLETRSEALPQPVAETAPVVAAVPKPEPAAETATDVATLLAADIPPLPVSAPVVKTAPPVSAFSPTVTKAARPEPPPVPKAETRPDVPLAIPPPQAVLHIAKEVDALGRIQCPRCRYRQVDTPFCVYCSFDLDRYWAASQRARELEARLGRSPPAN